jgi:hypothetical protein
MNEQEVVQLIENRRAELDIDRKMAVESVEKAIVEYKENPEEPGPVEHRVAWVVTYAGDWGMVEVHVDDLNQEVLRILRSA